jgi:hypothetical protein
MLTISVRLLPVLTAPAMDPVHRLLSWRRPDSGRGSQSGKRKLRGRRFGVPRYYSEKTCRIERDGFYIRIYDKDLNKVLTTHSVTWSRKDSFCIDQYSDEPEEQPTAPIKAVLHQHEEVPEIGFEKFDFGKKVHWND